MASTSSGKHPGGRRAAHVVRDNFTELEKVDNKSRRKYFQCNYCGDDDSLKGCRLEHRDNVLLLHLINPKECPNVSSEVRESARRELMQKGFIGGQAAVPLFRDNLPSAATDESLPALTEPPVAFTSAKKRKMQSGSLENFVDHGMTKEQQQSANVKLFR